MLYLPQMKKHLKTGIAIGILLATIGAFAYYLSRHPETANRLTHTPPLTVLALLAVYAASFLAYAYITRCSLQLFSKNMGIQENILFNAYSSLVNFFLPGQSGPLFRGAYLKKRHNLGVKPYVFATLIYYGFFAVLSVLLIVAVQRPWWQSGAAAIVLAGTSVLFVRRYKRRAHLSKAVHGQAAIAGKIGLVTGLQIALQVVIFALELHTVNAHASFRQVAAYTGVANLSLFVALTPGAIGIREAFLLFSHRLHHLDSSAIVAASVVDRAVYLVFLGLLFVLVMSLHAKTKLQVSQLTLNKPEN